MARKLMTYSYSILNLCGRERSSKSKFQIPICYHKTFKLDSSLCTWSSVCFLPRNFSRGNLLVSGCSALRDCNYLWARGKRSTHKYTRKSPPLAASSQTLKTTTSGCHVITWSGPNSEKSSADILQKSRPKSFEKVDIIPANDISNEEYSENFFSSKECVRTLVTWL
jgi:hypothetical protein